MSTVDNGHCTNIEAFQTASKLAPEEISTMKEGVEVSFPKVMKK